MHLAIIMDGNRRWAKERGLPSFEGHKEGAKKVKQVAKWCKDRAIKTLTLYAFSTENWNRSLKEVNFLMRLSNSFLTKGLRELQKEKVKLLVIGQREMLPVRLQEKIEKAEDSTRGNKDLTLILAISYGGRSEIVEAVKKIIRAKIKPEEINAVQIEKYLYTAGLPDPDLIIRTGGEQRLSNFLTWQSVYSELYFTEKYWPDFSEKDLDEALADYASHQRRYGK